MSRAKTKIQHSHGMKGGTKAVPLELIPGDVPFPPKAHAMDSLAGRPLFLEGGIRAGGDFETLPAQYVNVPKQGYDEHRYNRPVYGTVHDVPGVEGTPEEISGETRGFRGGAQKHGMMSCGFRGCSYADKDHGMLASHRREAHGLQDALQTSGVMSSRR